MNRLHDGQIDLTDADVRGLVDSQFPQWASLPLTPLDSTGTVNRVDLLGDHLVVRIPIIEWGAGDVPRDAQVLPMLGNRLPVEVPGLVGHGAPEGNLPWDWGIYTRLPGRHPVLGNTADEDALAAGLIELVATLRMMAVPASLSPTGQDIATQDEHTRPKATAIGSRALSQAWAAAVEASPFAQRAVFIHGDLMPGNFLLTDTAAKPRLTGVLDWASAGMGDPALDLLPAWSCLTRRTRSTFLSTLGATDEEIARARGYGARKVAWGLHYYAESLPEFAAALQFILDQIEDDLA